MSTVAFMPQKSFALVDASVYGGALFKGKVDGNSSDEPKGWQYGAKAHYNMSFIPMLELGLGAYFQGGKVKYDIIGSDETFSRSTLGFDGNLILGLPIVHPYARFTAALWDKFEDHKDKFCGYGIGGGIELSFIPFFRLFGEYMYDYVDHDGSLKTQNVNFGLKFDF